MATATVRALLLLSLAVGALGVNVPSVAADEAYATEVSFGIPRRSIVPGFDVSAECGVSVSYGDLVVPDGGEDETFFSMAPGPCTITVFVFDVPIPLPLVNSTPIGRTSYRIPGIGGFTFGLADVSIDLVLGVDVRASRSVEGLSANLADASWTRWGATSLNVAATVGNAGSTLRLHQPFDAMMNLSLGASVRALGIVILPVDVASLGTVTGTPSIEVPVEVDLRPSGSALSAWSGSHSAILVNWTRNMDDDFAYYRIVVAPEGGTAMVYIVERPETVSTEVPAIPRTSYRIEMSVVDRSGQVSEVNSVSVRTSAAPAYAPTPADGIVAFAALGGLLGFIGGFLARGWRRPRKPNWMVGAGATSARSEPPR